MYSARVSRLQHHSATLSPGFAGERVGGIESPEWQCQCSITGERGCLSAPRTGLVNGFDSMSRTPSCPRGAYATPLASDRTWVRFRPYPCDNLSCRSAKLVSMTRGLFLILV